MDTIDFKQRLESLFKYTIETQKQSSIILNFYPSELRSPFYSSISSKDKGKIIDMVTNFKLKKDIPKLQEFFVLLKSHSKFQFINQSYIKKHPLASEVERIKSGLFTSKIFAVYEKSWCSKTYDGFLRALNKKTLQIVNVNINGEKKQFLLKSNAGDAVSFSLNSRKGYNNLLLDPKTLDVYSYITSPTGKIIIGDVINLSDLSFRYLTSKPEFKEVLKEIKKELPNYIREKKKNYLIHYENKLKEKPEKQKLARKRINQIFSEKKMNSFTRSFGRSKSRVK